MTLLRLLAATWACALLFTSSTAQEYVGGLPPSLLYQWDLSEVPTVTPEPFDLEATLEEERVRAASPAPMWDARVQPLDVALGTHGIWRDLPEGGRSWRLRVGSPDAMAVELFFEDMFLPDDGVLFIIGEYLNTVVGGFSGRGMPASGRFSTSQTLGASCIIEYVEPAHAIGEGHFNVAGVGHAYRMNALLKADDCQVDVNCSEGDAWQEQRDAVVRMRVREGSQLGLCTGVLVNNTSMDCKPYILSALHCGLNSSSSDFLDYRFYFNYERAVCNSGGASLSKMLTGCLKRADSNCNGGLNGSDFMLLEMENTIPAAWNPYWAGWDATGAGSGSGVSIHHPSGSEKKISTYTQNLLTSQYNWPNGPQSHWFVRWSGTANGHGVTEGGSSGAPIFNAQKRIIGTLTGGSSYCNSVQPNGQNQPDLYGKFWWHWTNNPNPTDQKLRAWLDPMGTNMAIFGGSYDPCGPQAISEAGQRIPAPELFPNPAIDEVQLRLPAELQQVERVEVMDISGRLVYVFRPEGDLHRMDVSTWAAGSYVVSIVADGHRTAGARLVVARP